MLFIKLISSTGNIPLDFHQEDWYFFGTATDSQRHGMGTGVTA
jgi:hypothetical protein